MALTPEETVRMMETWFATESDQKTAEITGHSRNTVRDKREAGHWDTILTEMRKKLIPRRVEEIILQGDKIARIAMGMMILDLQQKQQNGEPLEFKTGDFCRLVETQVMMATGYTERERQDLEKAMTEFIERFGKVLDKHITDAKIRNAIAKDLLEIPLQTDSPESSEEITH